MYEFDWCMRFVFVVWIFYLYIVGFKLGFVSFYVFDVCDIIFK